MKMKFDTCSGYFNEGLQRSGGGRVVNTHHGVVTNKMSFVNPVPYQQEDSNPPLISINDEDDDE